MPKELEQVAAHVSEFRRLSAQINELTRQRDEVKAQIIGIMQENATDKLSGVDYTVTYRAYRHTSINGQALKRDHPEIYTKYARISQVPTFRVNKRRPALSRG